MTAADIAAGQPLDAARPWPGLDAFSEALHAYFFGRAGETEELFRRIRGDTVTLLFGQSGLGKTSLLRAGLSPRLRAAGLLPVYIRLDYAEFAPSPAAQIKAEFEREAAASGAEATPIGAEESLWAYFHRVDRVFASRAGEPLTPVLIFDQFEELFTLGLAREASRAASQSFLGELAELIENRPPPSLEAAIEADAAIVETYYFDRQDYRIVIALREDFLAQLDSVRARAPLIARNRFRLRRMTGRQGLEAVTKPLPGLVDAELAHEIVRFVGRASPEDAFGPEAGEAGDGLEVEPALLSLVCRELNERRLALGLDHITADLLAGNRDSIIQSFYDNALADQKPALRDFIEDELLSESGYRESCSLDRARHVLAAADVPPEALDTLVRRRLLRLEERLDVARVEIIHDVLTPVIRASRDSRHLREAEQAQLTQQTEARHQRLRRRVLAATAAGLVAALVLLAVAAWQWRVAQTQRAAAQRNLALATAAANSLVFDLAQKYRDKGIPAAVLEDILNRARQLQDQLAAGGDTSPELRRGQAVALTETSATLLTLGDYERAFAAANQALDILRALVAAAPGNAQFSRDLAAGNEQLGDVLRAQGDLVGATNSYRDGLAIRKTLTQQDPGDVQAQRDLAVSEINVGDALEERGDLAGAIDLYREARAIIAPLTAKDPGNDQWQRDLSVSGDRIAAVLSAQGDLPGALTAYRENLATRRALAAKDPSNTQWQRDLASTETKIGQVLQAQGDFAGALAAYREGEAILKLLTAKDPANTQWQDDLAFTDEKIGQVLNTQKNPQGSLAAYLGALASYQALAAQDPGNVKWPTNLWRINTMIGDVRRAQSDLAGALAAYRAALTVAEALVQKDPENAGWQSHVSRSDERIGEVLEAQGDLTGSLAANQEAVAAARRVYGLSALPLEKTALADTLGALAWTRLLNNRPQEALDAAQEALALDPSALWIALNQAHALLLLGRFDEAKAIYLENKDKPLNGKTFADSARADFAEMRKAGIDTPDMKRIEALLAG